MRLTSLAQKKQGEIIMGNRVIKKVPVKQGLYEENVTQQGDIGAVMEFEDGRKYVYSLNGAAALEPGLIVEGPAESANDEAIAIVTGTDVNVPLRPVHPYNYLLTTVNKPNSVWYPTYHLEGPNLIFFFTS